ncbi:MAG: DAK2 domain-containing protein [Clostridia bacterium]|nr:DAK2 domain-containing protein [Clostridia bacterium]
MTIKRIDAGLYRRMLCSAAAALQERKDEINRLNVFPVPDGDTGSNMFLTLDTVRNVPLQDSSLAAYSEATAKAVMRAARGNSGVILSLFFRGMASAFAGHEAADSLLLTKAFRSGSQAARNAVMKPVEGTILTVMKDCTDFETSSVSDDVTAVLQQISALARESLKKTPELLPALKKAKVVDSGGFGFTVVVEGMLKALSGESFGESSFLYEDIPNSRADFSVFSNDEIAFSFCTECLINRGENTAQTAIDGLHSFLDGLGDSVVLVYDDEIVKVHVHTNEPMTVLEKMMALGVPQFIKVENMRQQHSSLVTSYEQKEAEKETLQDACAVIAVANGDGLHDLFMELGASYTVSGGQSMNPSASDFLKAIKAVNSRRVIILPNNSNVILAAKQAAEMSEHIQVDVLNTVTIPQGISAMIAFDPSANQEDNITSMTSAKDTVKSFSVTRAVKNAEINGVKVRRRQFIGLVDKSLKYAENSLDECLIRFTEDIGDREIITLYYGKGIKREQAERHADMLRAHLGAEKQVTVVCGRQAVYHYLISAE